MTKAESPGETNESTTNDNFKDNEIIYVWADKNGTTDGYIKAWELKAMDNNGNFSGDSKTWPYDGSYLDFKAIHGNFGSTVTKNTTGQDAEITHSVKTTQSSETDVRTSDLLYAANVKAPTGQTVELSFGHKLSKIVVKLMSSDSDNSGSGISDDELDGATVTIIGVQPDVKFKLSAMAATTNGDPIDISLGSGGINVREYECIVPPQNIAEGKEFIRIELKDADHENKRKFHYVIPTGGLNLEEGNKYIYTLTVKNYISSFPGVVMPWNSDNFSFDWRWINPNPDGVVDWTKKDENTPIN